MPPPYRVALYGRGMGDVFPSVSQVPECGPYMAGFPGPLAASYGRAFIQKGRSESIGIGSGMLSSFSSLKRFMKFPNCLNGSYCSRMER